MNKELKDIISSNLDSCVDCKRCYKVCPMMKEFEESPKKVIKAVSEGSDVDKIAFSCMMCNSCVRECPKDIDLKTMFNNLRIEMYNNDIEKVNNLGNKVVRSHQKNSFSPLFTYKKLDKKVKKVFLPGCSLSAYSSNLVKKVYDYISKNSDDIGFMVHCCGKPTLDMGDVEGFKQYYLKLQKILDDNNIEEVIVACENCYKTIKENSPHIKVTSLWTFINDIGIPNDVKGIYKDDKETFALHDPCPIRDEEHIHEGVRNILKDLGINFKEFKRNRESTDCCGCGGMCGVTNKQLAIEQMKNRANSVEANCIISYCESCVEAMMTGGKKSIHIVDLLFNDEVINNKKFSQRPKNILKKWTNRYLVTKR